MKFNDELESISEKAQKLANLISSKVNENLKLIDQFIENIQTQLNGTEENNQESADEILGIHHPLVNLNNANVAALKLKTQIAAIDAHITKMRNSSKSILLY